MISKSKAIALTEQAKGKQWLEDLAYFTKTLEKQIDESIQFSAQEARTSVFINIYRGAHPVHQLSNLSSMIKNTYGAEGYTVSTEVKGVELEVTISW